MQSLTFEFVVCFKLATFESSFQRNAPFYAYHFCRLYSCMIFYQLPNTAFQVFPEVTDMGEENINQGKAESRALWFL